MNGRAAFVMLTLAMPFVVHASPACPEPGSGKNRAELIFSADILDVGIDEEGYNGCRNRPKTDAGCNVGQYLTAEVQPFAFEKGTVKGPVTLKAEWCAPYLPLRGGRERFYVVTETNGKETTYRYIYYEPVTPH